LRKLKLPNKNSSVVVYPGKNVYWFRTVRETTLLEGIIAFILIIYMHIAKSPSTKPTNKHLQVIK